MNPVNDAPYFELTPAFDGQVNGISDFDIHLRDVDSDGSRFEVEISTSYGGAFNLSESYLTSLSPDSILFTRGSGAVGPRLKFRVKTFRSCMFE